MSQATTKTTTIDGVEYTVGMLPARRATRLLTRLLRIVAPAAGALIDRAGGLRALLDAKVDGELFGPALDSIFSRADPDEVDAILIELAEVSLADGRPLKPIFDAHFMGRTRAMFSWARFALEVNYADFFGGRQIGALLADARKAEAAKA